MKGRPSGYTQEIADVICERLANGESLRRICRDDDMPEMRTVMRWLNAREEFCQQYARARELQAECIFDEMAEIADDGTNDWMASNAPDCEGYKLNGEHVSRSKLRIDARKWMLAKMAPRKYGDKQQVDHVSSDGSMQPASPEEAMTRIMGVLAIVEARSDAGKD